MVSATTTFNIVVSFVGALSGWYQYSLGEALATTGLWRAIWHGYDSIGNTNCTSFPQLEACEKLVLHQPSGVVYLACSNRDGRKRWTPSMGRRNAAGRSLTDYVATFDPSTSKIEHLKVVGFDTTQWSLQGMDVVPSADDPSQLHVYLTNQLPLHDPNASGFRATIEQFKTSVGSDTLTYVRTWDDPAITTPNDITASSSGDSFYFTNDHGTMQTGFLRDAFFDGLFRLSWGSIGYCEVDRGCEVVASGLLDPNGIIRNGSEQLFVGSSKFGVVLVYDMMKDGALKPSEIIQIDRPTDNLVIDKDGSVWAAAFPCSLHYAIVHWNDMSRPSPASALRITRAPKNEQPSNSTFKVEKLFEDDGRVASGSTTAAYDADRNILFLTGVTATHLTVCKLTV